MARKKNVMPKPPGVDQAPEDQAKNELDQQSSLENLPIEPEVQKKKAFKPYMVVATRAGYFDGFRKREGDKFMIKDEAAFSKNWMKKV